MKQPEGFVDADHPNWVWLLLKSLYGLKQAGKIWHGVVDTTLRNMGYTPTARDACLYVNFNTPGGTHYVSVYVDDFFMVGSNETNKWFIGQIGEMFSIKVTSPANLILNVQITSDNAGGFYISQSNYIQAMLEEFGMANVSPLSLPITEADLGTRQSQQDNVKPS